MTGFYSIAAEIVVNSHGAFENEGKIQFIVSRRAPADFTQTVEYYTADSSARSGIDYHSTNGTLTFQPNETQLTVDVALIDNGLVDGDRFLSLVITNPLPCANLLQFGVFCFEPPPSGLPPATGEKCSFDGPVIKDNEHPPTRLATNLLPDEQGGSQEPDRPLQDGSQMSFQAELLDFFRRANGKLIVLRRVLTEQTWEIVQLNHDGTVDPSFNIEKSIIGTTSLQTWVEQPDGRIFLAQGFSLRRLNVDGSLDSTFLPQFLSFCTEVGHMPPTIRLAPTGEILFYAFVSHVDGFPVPDFIRLIDQIPVPAFRLFSSHLKTASGNAALKVVRTGPTTNSASIEFTTVDDLGNAGMDYTARSGVLNFGPLETSKDVVVPILRRGTIRFSIKLSNQIPAASYSVPAPIPVQIDALPEFRLSLGASASNQIIRVEGTAPGETYLLERSVDLKTWTSAFGQVATFSALQFEPGPQRATSQFYRVKVAN